MTVPNRQVGLLVDGAARRHDCFAVRFIVVGGQLLIGGGDHEPLHILLETALAVRVQRQRRARFIGQAEAVDVGGEQRLERRRERDLLLGHHALVGDADDAGVRPLVLGAVIVVQPAEEPLVGGVRVFEVVDGAVAARGKNIVAFVRRSDFFKIRRVVHAVAGRAGEC